MFYIEDPDTTGHSYGINHQKMILKIKELDGVTKYLYQNLKKLGLNKRVNVIHTADHGMVSVTQQRVITVSDILEPESYWPGDSSPFVYIYPKKRESTEFLSLHIFLHNQHKFIANNII